MSKLVFVYNTDSGYTNAVADGLRKIVSPSTYSCKLCSLTYGVVTMKDQWKSFIKSLGMDAQFIHKNQFVDLHPDSSFDFPVVIHKSDDKLVELISADEFSNIDDLDVLIETLKRKLNEQLITS